MCHLFQLLKLMQREVKVKFVYFFWFLNDFQFVSPLKFTFILIKSKLIKDQLLQLKALMNWVFIFIQAVYENFVHEYINKIFKPIRSAVLSLISIDKCNCQLLTLSTQSRARHTNPMTKSHILKDKIPTYKSRYLRDFKIQQNRKLRKTQT